MFPEVEYLPAETRELVVLFPVSGDIAFQLLSPPHRVVLREGCVLGAHVPEASVDEHSKAGPGKHNIGSTGKCPVVDAEP